MRIYNANRGLLLTVAMPFLLLGTLTVSPLLAQTGPKRPAEADKIHVVLLVAGHDAGIGNADMKDIAAMKKALGVAFKSDKNRLVFHDLTGTNNKTGRLFTAADILNYLRAMKVGRNDNVLVYHSGHGGINDQKRPEETHILTVDGGQLARKDIRTIVAAKQPRALMILTDCCSSYMRNEEAHAAQRPPAAAANVNVATIRNLMLKATGTVNITAAQDGKEALAGYKGENPGQAGSAFTVALLRLWYANNVTYTSWEQMFPSLRTETQRASGGAHQARAFQINTNPVSASAQPNKEPAPRD